MNYNIIRATVPLFLLCLPLLLLLLSQDTATITTSVSSSSSLWRFLSHKNRMRTSKSRIKSSNENLPVISSIADKSITVRQDQSNFTKLDSVTSTGDNDPESPSNSTNSSSLPSSSPTSTSSSSPTSTSSPSTLPSTTSLPSSHPSTNPTITSSPTANPSISSSPTLTPPPSPSPSLSFLPTTSLQPSPLPTASLSPSHAPVPDITWTGCVDHNAPAADEFVYKGVPTSICIVVSGGENWADGMRYSRWLFRPVADEYSYFAVDESYEDLVISDNHFLPFISVHVGSGHKMSFIRRYYDNETGHIFPHLTAVIDIQDGNIVGITWDDACVFCKKSQCLENTFQFNGNSTTQMDRPLPGPSKGCFYTKEQCAAREELASAPIDQSGEAGPVEDTRNICRLHIYFVWTGTDRNGKVLNSFASRYSAFPTKGLMDFIPDIKLPDIDIPFIGGDKNESQR